MISAFELRKGNLLFHAKTNAYVHVNTIGTESCLVKPYGDKNDAREFDVLFEELEGIELAPNHLRLSGFKDLNRSYNFFHPSGLNVKLTENTFWIMDRTDTALSKRLSALHHLQNVYASLTLKELDIHLKKSN